MVNSHRVRNTFVVRRATVALAALLATGAQAQSYFDPQGLFPSPHYIEQDPLFITYLNGWFIRGLDFFVMSGRIVPPPAGTLISNFNLNHDYELSPPGGPFSPVAGGGTGAASITFDHFAGTTAVFVTEMLSLNLSGGPAMVRESPTMASMGGFSRTPSGGGWQVDSFFDVFTEISLDGGQTWSPSVGSTHMLGTPEPGSMLVLGAGAALLAWRRRKLPR